ncbi:MAG: RNA 3'-terminal phosphate cyclase [Candidatus Aenigmatarchaeota archaeon]
MIHIDGSIGGGQMLRSAISLSALTGKGVRITEIRKGKENAKPGLRPQHMKVIETIGSFCNAEILGLKENSLEIDFRPWQLSVKDRKIDIGTAGSVSLLVQSVLPLMFFSNKENILTIKGGTDVSWSPSINYLKYVFLPMLRKMGAIAELEILNHGFYPKGGGEVKLRATPVKQIKPISAIERGGLIGIHLESVVGKYPKEYAERQAKSALGVFEYELPKEKISVSLKAANTEDFGSSMLLYALFENSIIGVDAISERGFEPEKFGLRIAEDFVSMLKKDFAADKFLADQLLLYMALAKGKSQIKVEQITEHCLTNIHVIEKFLPVNFEIDKVNKIISVEGANFSKE